MNLIYHTEDKDEPMNILAIGPHPDDIECYCGGALALYAERGHRITNACITNGNMGSMEYAPDELAAVREGEARAAAAVIGAEVIWAGLGDASLTDSIDNRNIFIDIIRRSRPDVILCPSPDDYHPDHRACSLLARDAALLASAPLIETGHPATDRTPYIFYHDHPNGVSFEPEEYVDVTSVMDTKLKMMACHRSQISWLRSQYGMDFAYSFETMARFRGLACGCLFAEGFRPDRTFPGSAPARLLP
ncbi:MAG: PIG-L family deacetylase [Abditibacteriota bacterium]|nr:PIG-L family deacetylase [Abditibacteriota bacterium]